MMLSMEMTRLIERCKQGDAEALGELYKAYAQKMRGVCRRYVDEQVVDDVLHDAFVIIFTSFDRLRDVRKAESWILAITRNVASKYKDHQNTIPTVPLESAATMPASEEEPTARGIPLDEVMQALNRLPEGYANVFRLSVFEGLSHKEIAALLDIEPHSSSSQLTRAKKMLRKSLARYWMLWLLPLLLPVVFYFYTRNKPSDEQEPTATKHDKQPSNREQTPPDEPSKPVAPIPQPSGGSTQRYIVDATLPADTLRHIAEQVENTDTIVVPPSQSAPENHHDRGVNMGESERQPIVPIRKVNPSHWGVAFTYSGDFNRWTDTGSPVSIWMQGSAPADDATCEVPLWEVKTWSDYLAHLYEVDMPEEERDIHIKIAEANVAYGEDEIRRTTHHDLPFTVSLALRRQIAPRWSLETGISYTRLSSQFITGIPQAGFADVQKIHYLGIPLSASYQWLGTKRWSLYTSMGATLEMPVRATLTTEYRLDGTSFNSQHQSFHAPLQWSVGVGLGLQYSVTLNVGLFAEPRLQYFIPTDSNVETYRTEHPLNLTMPFGIRFTW